MFATRPCAFISFATGHLRTLDATGRSSRLLLVVRIGLKIVVLFFSFPAQGHIVFAQTSSTLQNPELRRLAVRFRLVHCSRKLHAPLISIPGPFRNSESGHLAFPRFILLCLQGP